MIIIVGDFNADFDHGGLSADLLSDFVLDFNLSVCDLHYRESVKFTYERNDGLVRSWIDHILCSQAISILVTDIYTLQSGVNLSDHFPLFLKLHINHSSLSSLPATSSSKLMCIAWSEITSSHIANYLDMFCDRLSDPPAFFCPAPFLITLLMLVCWMIILNIIMSTMLRCAPYCFPCKRSSFKRVPGWKDSAGQLRRASNFWHRVWEEAGCPSSGVLSTIKRQVKKGINLKYALLNADANILFVIGLPIPSQRERRILSG